MCSPRSALLLAAVAVGCSRPAERPNVLLLTVDTLRIDRLDAVRMPRVVELARDGLVFPRGAQSPRAKTTPALASLMTGLYPHEHGVRELGTPLAPDVLLLAEAFHAAGYRTAAIVGNYVLKDAYSGLARGFDVWIEDMPDGGVPPDGVPQRKARGLTDAALAMLGADGRAAALAGDGPWFVWLHYMDPHGAYEPPPEYAPRRAPEAELVDPSSLSKRGWIASYNVPERARLPDGRFDAALVRALYDGEVHYVDAEIGRLVDALRSADVLDDTLVVLTSDHGESLGEHEYYFEHGRHAYEVTCRVPLVVRLPPRSFEDGVGERAGDLSLADLAPTLCELLELPPLPPGTSAVRGRSRARMVLGRAPSEHPVFCEKVVRTERSGAVQVKAVRIGDWKLLRSSAVGRDASGNPDRLVVLGDELYDLASDPYETHDLSNDPPARAPLEALRLELLRFTTEEKELGAVADRLRERWEELRRIDPDAMRVLEALGY